MVEKMGIEKRTKELYVSDKNVEIEIKIENTEGFMDEFGGRDYTTYQSFKSLRELFEWIVENIDFIKEAEENGYEIALVFRAGNKKGNKYEWFFDIDDEGMMRFSIGIGNLLDEEHKKCLEKLRKIEEIIEE